jgi:hypothetical protein
MEITYLGFCALGSLTNPKLFTRSYRAFINGYPSPAGEYYVTKYYMIG